VGNEAITSNGVLTTNKGVIVIANFSTLSGCIAEGQTSDRRVGIGVSSHKIKEECNAWATASTWISKLCAASARMTDEQFNNEGRNFKESVNKWSSHYSSPIFMDESTQWRVPMMRICCIFSLSLRWLRIPVPINWISSNTVNDWIKLIIHASLRNRKPQMSSRILRTPKKPGLEKSKKLLF